MKRITMETWQSIGINDDQGWRNQVGILLQNLATWIDGRTRLAVEIQSVPPLTERQRMECIGAGVVAIDRAIRSELHSECLEMVMRQELPNLYRKEGA
jgi:hypothetical protein